MTAARNGEISAYIENGLMFFKPSEPIKKLNKCQKFLKDYYVKLYQKRSKKFLEKLDKGIYNRSPIVYKRADTIEETIKFAKQNGLFRKIRGIDKNNPNDLELVNTLVESLCKVHNKTEGRSIMPRSIIVKDALKSADGYRANAAYQYEIGRMLISRETILNPFTVYHELGHANHALYKNLSNLSRKNEIIARSTTGVEDCNVLENFLEDKVLQNLIRKELREYSATSPAEFVADVFANWVAGKNLSKELLLANKALGGYTIG